MAEKYFDVVIIGAGPAGLSAGLYAARAGLSALILEKLSPGGQAAITDKIENYPGGLADDSGPVLSARMAAQAESFGAVISSETVKEADFTGALKLVKTRRNEYRTKAVIIATGGKPKRAGCPGEAEFTGRGVSYCATCDAAFFRGQDVFVIGGGDSAVEEALFIAGFAGKVTIVHRRNELRAAKSLVDKAARNEKIAFLWDSVAEEIRGGNQVESIVFRNVKTGETSEYRGKSLGVFVFVGYEPVSELFAGKVLMDGGGYIITDENMKTSVPGVFAAGDVRAKSLRQVVTAAADGAIAGVWAEKYVSGLEGI